MFTFALVFFAVVFCSNATDPSYDHQNTTYYADIKPVLITGIDIDITPYFSPDHSVEVEVELIMGAFSSIDIMIPGFDSWVDCSYPGKEGCMGCDPLFVRNNESFTIFQALLDSVNRGVKVRILTNNYDTPICKGKMDPLTFIELAGADVRYFRTVTFLHNKYIARDKDATAISSINYSYTSFMKNREAGVIFEDQTGKISEYLSTIFETDWALSYTKAPPHYTEKELEPTKDRSQIAVRIPPPRRFNCKISSPLETILASSPTLKYYASPDMAYDTIISGLDEAKKSVMIYIYQITDSNISQKLIDLHNNGIKITIMVSCAIYGEDDRDSAYTIYKSLLAAGLKIQMTMKGCFSFAHQKFWIVDDQYVWLSSGNWSPSDLPKPPYVFPPYSEGSSGWRKTNRDMSFMVDAGDELVKIFQRVFFNDYNQGFDYTGDEAFKKRIACS